MTAPAAHRIAFRADTGRGGCGGLEGGEYFMSKIPDPDWQMNALKEIEAKWYDFFYSIIFTPPGEIPQTKGSWRDGEPVVEMIGHLKTEYPGTQLLVVNSRCGEVHAEDADEWLEMRQIGMEYAEAEAAYIKAGVCSQCGACSAKEAERKCRPTALGDTGDYSCNGERLWEGEERE